MATLVESKSKEKRSRNPLSRLLREMSIPGVIQMTRGIRHNGRGRRRYTPPTLERDL